MKYMLGIAALLVAVSACGAGTTDTTATEEPKPKASASKSAKGWTDYRPDPEAKELTSEQIHAQLKRDFANEAFQKHISEIDAMGGTTFVQMPPGSPVAEVMAACIAVRGVYMHAGVEQPAISVMAGSVEAADGIPGRRDGKCQQA